MAATADELLQNDNFQIPLIDLQRFCQDELNTAARLFGDFPETKFSSMISPKIDKSIFNESAGSRRQTYSGGRVSRRRKGPIPNSHAKEDSEEINLNSLVNFSSSRGKSGSNKKSSKSILDSVGKFLYIFNKEEKNRLNARSSLSSYASEERDVRSVPLFKELKEEDHNKEVFNVSPNIQEAENFCQILRGDPEMEGRILEIQKSFENADGLEEDKSKVLDNACPDIPNAMKKPQVSKEDLELKGGMGRFKMLSEGLERSQEDQNKVAVDSSTSIAESGNASEVLGRDTAGGIWGIRKLLETSDRLQEGQHKVVINASPHLLETNCASEVLRGSLEMEEDIGEIKKSFENFEGFQVSGEIFERSKYVSPGQESKVSGEENIDTQHGLQVRSQERQLYEQVQGSMKDFARLVETSELQNRGKVYEKQSQVYNFCAEHHRYISVADGMDRPKRKRGRPKKKTTEWGSVLLIDIKKEECEKELASDAMNQAGEELASGSRKRVRSGSPCSASKGDAGYHFSSDSRKRVHNGLSRGASKDGNELGVETQFYHRNVSSEAATQVETSELQNRGKVYEKQSQVYNFCAEHHRYISVADGMDRPKRKRGRPKKKTTEWGSVLSIDIEKEECEKELASNAINQTGEHLASGSRKRVRSGSPCTASKEDAGNHFSSDSRKRVNNGLPRGASKDVNELGVETQSYHRNVSSETATLDRKEVSSDASVAGDIIAKPTGPANDRAINEKCKVDVTERANATATAFYTKQLYGTKLKKEKMTNRKNEHDMLRQMSCTKKQKILPADDFLESWKNRLPNGWKVEVGLQRTEGGKYDYYHKFVSPDGVQFPEMKETSKYESSVCRQEDDVKGSSDTDKIEFCNISQAGYRGSNQRTDISYEEDRNGELNTSSKLDSPGNIPISSDSDEAKGEAHTYVCKLCGKNFNCYRHYEGHVAAHAPTSHRRRGRPRLRGKLQNVPPLEKKEDGHDQIISNENLQSTSVNDSDNPDKLKRKVGRPRVCDSDRHKEMYCNTGIQSESVMFYVNQAGSKGNVNEPHNSNVMDMDCGHAILSGSTTVLVNTTGSTKPERPRNITEPICGYDNKDDDMNHTNNNRDDFADTDCVHDMQSAGTPVLVNTIVPKRKCGRRRIVGVKRKRGRPRIVGLKRKPGRSRKIKERICINGNHDDERNCTDNDRDEANNSLRSYQDVEENLPMCEQPTGLQTSIDRDACEKIDGLPRYGDTTHDEVHYFVDTDCDSALQSAGTPLLVHTVGLKRKPGRPRTVRPKMKPGRLRKIKEPICSNDSHDNERNYSGDDRDGANNSFSSYRDVEEKLSICKQSAGLQNSIDQDVCEKIDELPRCGDNKDTTGDSASADPSLKKDGWRRLKDEMQVKGVDCGNDSQPLGAQVLVTQVGKLGWTRNFQVPICSDSKLDDEINSYSSSGNQDEERHCQCGNIKDEMRISLDGELNFNKIDQSIHVMAPDILDRSENFTGMQKLGKISRDEEMPHGKTFQNVGLVTNLDTDEQNKWFEEPRVKDDREDVEPSSDRINQSADSKNPVDSTSPMLENMNLDSTLQEYSIHQNSKKTTDDCFAEAGTLFPAANIGKLDPNKIATGENAPFVDHEIEWDPSRFVVCQWCDQDFDFSSVSHLGSPCSWICPGCKTVNNVSSL